MGTRTLTQAAEYHLPLSDTARLWVIRQASYFGRAQLGHDRLSVSWASCLALVHTCIPNQLKSSALFRIRIIVKTLRGKQTCPGLCSMQNDFLPASRCRPTF
jgi:hypothetical protein